LKRRDRREEGGGRREEGGGRSGGQGDGITVDERSFQEFVKILLNPQVALCLFFRRLGPHVFGTPLGEASIKCSQDDEGHHGAVEYRRCKALRFVAHTPLSVTHLRKPG